MKLRAQQSLSLSDSEQSSNSSEQSQDRDPVRLDWHHRFVKRFAGESLEITQYLIFRKIGLRRGPPVTFQAAASFFQTSPLSSWSICSSVRHTASTRSRSSKLLSRISGKGPSPYFQLT